MKPEEQAVAKWLAERAERGYEHHGGPCCCPGPQDGNPFCGCKMVFVVRVGSSFYKIDRKYIPTGEELSAKLIEPDSYLRDGTPVYGERWKFDLDIIDIGPNKIEVMKELRKHSNLELKTVVELLKQPLPIMVLHDEYDRSVNTLVQKLTEAGATVKIV